MHCSPKTLRIVALALVSATLAAYFMFPSAQALILANGPWLLFLVCPIAMLAMMWSMRGGAQGGRCHGDAHKPATPPSDAADQR